MEEKINEIELRSDQVESILGRNPAWIIRWGITVILIVVLVIFAGSFFFVYPDTIIAPVTITTQNPPARMVAKASGKISKLFVADNEQVSTGKVLAIIENPANYEDILALKSMLKLPSDELLMNKDLLKMQFGEVTPAFLAYWKALSEYNAFRKNRYHEKKIAVLDQQMTYLQNYIKEIDLQAVIARKDFEIERKMYHRDTTLYKNKVIAEAELDKSASQLLQKEHSLSSSRVSIENARIQLVQLTQSKFEVQADQVEKEQLFTENIYQTLHQLESQLASWEQSYCLKSPCDGKVTFTKYWSVNHTINTGENLLTVIPANGAAPVCKAKLPAQKSGKVKLGQQVNIKLTGFPYTEFGILRGKITSISAVPEEEGYIVEIAVPADLRTNYEKKLPLIQEMTGDAEIITENMSVFNRFLNPVKSVLKNQTE